ncbi:MAG: aminotransferase class I/II-fold pyridoxal phosphate-dependent enzyme [Actinobacteria bacterium]|nr:aminotransferase class I/II-fold pyridoxal phosphate-dependent enzyme [Actinomycetota bacterium]
MLFSTRMEKLPPYLFAEIERKIAEKKKAGVDVISLGMGDPDLPTPAYIVEEMQRQVADPRNHRYPTNAGVEEFARAAVPTGGPNDGFSMSMIGPTIMVLGTEEQKRHYLPRIPEKEFFPLLGSKEGLAHICWSTLDPGDLSLVPDPGYPVYAGSSLLAGAEVKLLPLKRENDFLPDLDSITPAEARRAKLLFISYPNNPTAAVADGAFFAKVVAFAKEYDIAVVHDNAYSELTFDGYVAPSFLATPGAKDVGVEFFSLSKPFNMTGWRVGFGVGNQQILEHLWRLKTNLDSGMFEAIQRTAAFVLNGPWDFVREMNAVYQRRRDVLIEALQAIGLEADKPKATIYLWVPVPAGYTSASFAEHVLDQAGVVLTPGNGYGAAGEGFVRASLTVPDDRIGEAVERIEKSLVL